MSAIAAVTAAASASITDFASASYSDFATATSLVIATTFVDNAAFEAATPTPIPPPPGIIPNLHDKNMNGKSYIVVAAIGLFFATTVTLMRLYTKAFIVRSFGWDDLGTLFLGEHTWNIHTSNARKSYYEKLSMFANSVYLFVLCLVKVSILLLYLRTFHICGRKFRWTLYGVLILIVSTHIAAIPIDWLIFTPVECLWKYNDLDDEDYFFMCHINYSTFPYFTFLGVLTILLDLVIIFLPAREVWQLQMVRRQKLVLVGVFLAGLVVTLASTLRLAYSIERYFGTGYFDNEYSLFQINLASTIELDLALICASIPTLQAFARRFAPRLLNLDSPRSSPNQANFSVRFKGWPKLRTLTNRMDKGSSVTADPERQSQLHLEKSIDDSYINISEDGRSNELYPATTHSTDSRPIYTVHNSR